MTAATGRTLRLGAFIQDVGHHIAAWRHPDVDPAGGASFEHYRALAAIAERGKFDAFFLGDQMTFQYEEDERIGRTARVLHLEPLTLLGALSIATSRIGLVATASTSYNEPFHLARKFATLDHLSKGRIGWNIVTSWTRGEARNFSLDDVPDHGARYRRAVEFVEVVKGLWDSWEDDAFRFDQAAGQFFDPDRLHVLDHRGEHFKVRGPLNIARPPQGYPVLVQAGSSDDGQDLAARTAELVFTAQPDFDIARSFYSGLKARAAAYGRDPDHLKILPGLMPVIGRTEAEAHEKFERLQALIHPEIGWPVLTRHLGGADLSGYPLDGPVPETLPETQGNQSRLKLLTDIARRDGLSVRDLYNRVTGTRGHWAIIGTKRQIVEEMAERFLGGAADGFNIMPPWFPGGLAEFVDEIVPELQRLKLFRTEYSGTTLRDHLGLPRPANRYSHEAAVPARSIPV